MSKVLAFITILWEFRNNEVKYEKFQLIHIEIQHTYRYDTIGSISYFDSAETYMKDKTRNSSKGARG